MRAILTFHSVDDSASVLSYPAQALEDLLQGLRDADVPIVTLDTLLSSERGVALTFDDGMQSVHERALPVLRAAAIPSHLYLTTGSVGRDNRWPSQPAAAPHYDMLTWSQIETCASAGMLIESHTVSHPDLRTLDSAAIEHETATADAEIEARIGRRPQHFAYPYGWFDARVAATLAPRYRSCVTTRLGYLSDDARAEALPRIDTYYLRGAWWRRRVSAAPTHLYLSLRGILRRLRGSE